MLMIKKTFNSLNEKKNLIIHLIIWKEENLIIFDVFLESVHLAKQEARDCILRNIGFTEETRKKAQMYFVLIIE